jgi:ADP-heptose:LPS heptosyltransferase
VKAQRIAVFRALQLGDMLCAVPALRALRAHAPDARITLIGLPWAESFAARYAAYVDDFLAFPGFPGMPEQDEDGAGFIDFVRTAHARRFDLAMQMHGTGGITNALVALLGAKRNVGFREPDSAPCDGFLPWPDEHPEVWRYLLLLRYLGIPLRGEHLELPVHAEEDEAWRSLARRHRLQPGRYVVIHPGARLPSRRWHPERFAAVGRKLASGGLRIAVTGSASESPLTAEVLSGLPANSVDLTGETSLGSLARVVGHAALLVCNDTGISHVAAAMAAPSVVVASGSDVRRWAPLDRERHVVLHHALPCRPCAHPTCPYPDHPCAAGVEASAVIAAARRQLARKESHVA